MENIEEKEIEIKPSYVLPATMDNCGRILIPASIRKVTEITTLSNLVIKVVGKQLIIESTH